MLALGTLIGSTLSAVFLAWPLWHPAPLLSVAMLIFCIGKIGGSGLMLAGKRKGLWLYSGGEVAFTLCWYVGVMLQLEEVRKQLENMPPAFRQLASRGTLTALGNSPLIASAILLCLGLLWILLWRLAIRGIKP